MCGRYYVADEEEIIEMREIINEVNKRYADSEKLAVMKTGEIFPTDVVPVLTSSGQKRNANLMSWGFPRWEGSGVIINARAETAIEKSMFRYCLSERRCLVPATGFFEWMHKDEKKKKEKFLLCSKDKPMLYMAGLYNTFKDKNGQPQESFVILTTAANESVSPIHNRMPVLLTGSKRHLWLHDDLLAAALINEKCTAELMMIAQG